MTEIEATTLSSISSPNDSYNRYTSVYLFLSHSLSYKVEFCSVCQSFFLRRTHTHTRARCIFFRSLLPIGATSSPIQIRLFTTPSIYILSRSLWLSPSCYFWSYVADKNQSTKHLICISLGNVIFSFFYFVYVRVFLASQLIISIVICLLPHIFSYRNLTDLCLFPATCKACNFAAGLVLFFCEFSHQSFMYLLLF